MSTKHLQELIRSVGNNLLSKEEKIGHLSDPILRQRLYGKFPMCYIKLCKKKGRDINPYLVPICNRGGIVDPAVINISIQAIEKLMSDKSDVYDINDLQTTFDKLSRLKSKYEKEVVKTSAMAGRKAYVTRMFNKIKNHLHPEE